jgi:gp32 DNA binding protein like
MSLSFNDLKRTSANSFDKLNQELSKLNQNGGGSSKDDRLWSCQTDKAGNGYAIIRFLPAPSGEDVPFVRMWSHGFKGPGGWYIENSLTTLGQQDPVAEMNTALWNEGEGSAGRKRVTGQGRDNPGTKRQLSYFSNIYIVKDPANPENEGKVFLFKYGKKIFDKLNDLMNPQFPDEKPCNPFDFWSGANFVLKIRRVDGYANFDSSTFESPAPLADDDKLETVWKSQYSLQEIVSLKNFKSYEELQKRLDRALGKTSGATPSKSRQTPVQEDDDLPWANEQAAPSFKSAPPKSAPAASADDDDDDFAFFNSLKDD